MSDQKERACSMCGSLLHHEDDCKRQGSNHDTLCAITTLLFPDRGCWSKGMLTDGIKSLQSQLAALKLENEKLVEEVAKVNRFRESLATKHRFANDLLAEYQAREMLRSEFERAEIERLKGTNPQTNFNQT